MSTWYKKDLGDGVAAFEPSSRLHQAFLALAASGELPKVVGVYSIYDLETNIVSWYFSPEAESLAKLFNAAPCDKPIPKEGFGLLAGNGPCWEDHFPDYVNRKRM